MLEEEDVIIFLTLTRLDSLVGSVSYIVLRTSKMIFSDNNQLKLNNLTMDIDLRLPSGEPDKEDEEPHGIDNMLEHEEKLQNGDIENGNIVDVRDEVHAEDGGDLNSPTADMVVFKEDTNLEPLFGMEFASHGEAYSFYQEYARSMGFNTAIQNSRRSKTSREFIDAKFACSRYGTKREYDKSYNRPRARQNKQDPENATGRRSCSKTDCKASMHVKRRPDGKWVIHNFVKEHNHELLPAQAVSEQTRKMYAAMARQFAEYKNVVGLKNDPKNPFDKGRNLALEAGDLKILLDFFTQMQNMNSNFFYAIDLGEDQRLKSLFWVDAKSRHDYINFSDVVSFDTTYIRNKYKMPLVLFVGVNQHYQFCIHRSSTNEEFEKRWWKILEKFELKDDEWTQSLYEDRKQWVPTYMRDVCLAGMSAVQRSESVNSFFDKYVHKKTTVQEFLKQYEAILQDRYEEEAKADSDTWNKQPTLRSPSPLEKSVSGVYTHAVFKKFQVEVLGAVACHPKREGQDETTITFRVQDFEKNQDFIVTWNEMKTEVSCLCCLFEYKGYLCRHALIVLQICGLSAIPAQYILKRWTKDVKNRHLVGEESDHGLSRVQKFNDLCQRAMKVIEEGSLSQESYSVACRALEEAFGNCVSVNNSSKSLIEAGTSSVTHVDVLIKLQVNSEPDVMTVGAQDSLQQMDKLNPRAVTLDGYYGAQQSVQGMGQLNSIAPSHDGYYSAQQSMHGLGQMDFFRTAGGFTYGMRDDPNVRTAPLHDDASRHA
ncbi:hypothetical protein GBA52_011016 [Prunus armeniaca]|nr:hypothetical protein GBA52_011016 [Prunus armeniaca]